MLQTDWQTDRQTMFYFVLHMVWANFQQSICAATGKRKLYIFSNIREKKGKKLYRITINNQCFLDQVSGKTFVNTVKI